MESSIEMMFGIAFLVVGLSHIAQPRVWAEFFVMLRGQGEAGIFAVALVTLPAGLLIVSFHNTWTGLPTVLTVIGWGYCAKCFVYMVFPRAGLAALAKISVEKPGKFIVVGVMLVVMSGICWWSWFARL
ncbi:MAG: hypothetical protein IH989_04895 [Planctomycetes bacterium]|nr:hypothetical protein [Planctomycetota bacterium]